MAPHAKYIAIYDTPFWRDQGLSGEARSARGPFGEIHDASMPGGCAALFGFFGVPAQVRQNVSHGAHGTLLSGRLESPQTTPRGWAIFAHCFTCGKDSVKEETDFGKFK
ncbi:hypothetical protein BamIOP4010DRAFT_1927 [Burkholderia ambifaria IOP40-10]|uniref:Uncharacterized protein n=1 Tax=Burkholderia ambifaria IOP40-10 TaxID=396596 RepID=B1FD18_9BURK|nr:hypothetical protein BamIOP4010DRAFT_1927 [Burkholderia ambifaria IOP40-10]